MLVNTRRGDGVGVAALQYVDFCPCDKPIGPGLRGSRGASKKTGVFSSMSYWEMKY